MDYSDADLIWNRATRPDSGALASGDRALAALLLFHGLAMNGGVLHAFEVLSTNELDEALSGFRYFGLLAAADFLEEASRMLMSKPFTLDDEERMEFEFDRRYGKILPDDESIAVAFESVFRQQPSDFEPVGNREA